MVRTGVMVVRLVVAAMLAIPAVPLVLVGAVILGLAQWVAGLGTPEPVTTQDDREAAVRRRVREVIDRAMLRP